jgi:hypothetical protein
MRQSITEMPKYGTYEYSGRVIWRDLHGINVILSQGRDPESPYIGTVDAEICYPRSLV